MISKMGKTQWFIINITNHDDNGRHGWYTNCCTKSIGIFNGIEEAEKYADEISKKYADKDIQIVEVDCVKNKPKYKRKRRHFRRVLRVYHGGPPVIRRLGAYDSDSDDSDDGPADDSDDDNIDD